MPEANSAVRKSRRIPYGLAIVACAVIIQLIGWGTFGTFGVFVNEFEKQFGWSRASISGVASVVLLMSGVFSIAAGNLSDRLGPRVVISVCSVIFGLGILLTSRVGELWQLYLTWGVVLGIGVSSFDVAVLSTVARWFGRTRGAVTGIVKAGAGLGHLSIPLVAGSLIVSQGWRSAYMVLAALGLVLVIVPAQFLRRNPRSRSVNGAQPLFREPGITLKQAVHRGQFWAILAGYAALLFCTYTVQVHIAPDAISLGSPVTQAAAMLSLIGASSVLGRFSMGGIGDRIGTGRAMAICCGMLTITLACLSFVRVPSQLYLVLPFYGFAHGGSYALISPHVANLFGTGSHGAIFGVVNFSGTVGGAIGPLLAGSLFDAAGTYSVVFLILSATSLVALALMAPLRPVFYKETESETG